MRESEGEEGKVREGEGEGGAERSRYEEADTSTRTFN